MQHVLYFREANLNTHLTYTVQWLANVKIVALFCPKESASNSLAAEGWKAWLA